MRALFTEGPDPAWGLTGLCTGHRQGETLHLNYNQLGAGSRVQVGTSCRGVSSNGGPGCGEKRRGSEGVRSSRCCLEGRAGSRRMHRAETPGGQEVVPGLGTIPWAPTSGPHFLLRDPLLFSLSADRCFFIFSSFLLLVCRFSYTSSLCLQEGWRGAVRTQSPTPH